MTDTIEHPETEDTAPQEPRDALETPGEPQETPDSEADTFDRAYVEKLRREAGDARVRAKDRDDLAHRLHTALVAATGRLADPSDLPYDENHLTDPDALTAAVDDLLTRKPHLAPRRPRGDVGQGVGAAGQTVDLAGILRSRT